MEIIIMYSIGPCPATSAYVDIPTRTAFPSVLFEITELLEKL
jgi:hypothetical protein